MTEPQPRAADELEPLSLSSARVALWGTIAWALALALTLVVPSLHSGARDWWPWTCVTGIVLGVLGYGHIRRGHDASDAR